MNKKKLLIVVPSFNVGGTIVSLYSLLSIINITNISIDILAFQYEGQYIDKLPNCKILKPSLFFSGTSKGFKGLKLPLFLCIQFFKKVCTKCGLNAKKILYKTGGIVHCFNEYDTMICYAESVVEDSSLIPVRNKVAWIHCDYARVYEQSNKQKQKESYSNFYSIVCVSEYAKKVFDKIMPEYKDRSVAIHNIINVQDIKNKSIKNEDLDPLFVTDSKILVSVGRLDPIKQFSLIPRIYSEIKKKTSVAFKWYIIGGGFPEELLRIQSEVNKYGVASNVILLGNKTNPYPYIAKSDIYVCTSKSESFPLSVNEAKALCKPVISTNFPSALESIKDGIDGYVTSIENLPKTIAYVLNNPMNINYCRINNENSIHLIYNILSL